MRKSLQLILCIMVMSWTMNAQYQNPTNRAAASTPAPYNAVKYTGEEIPPAVPMATNTPVFSRTDTETNIGQTVYDLQTNSACQNRLVRSEDGTMAAVFTFGNDAANGYPERGAGYNYYDGTEWGDFPEERIESERTGWPGIALLPDGSQVVITHANANRELTINRNASGAWVETKIPSTVPSGMLWPRIASGGPDGNSVHAVAISTPEANNGGAIYEGVDGHILYYRSLDGGATWDMVDVIIPGLDNTNFNNMDADSYVIDASGDIVAIGLFSGWGDVIVAISEDNGDTWNLNNIHDFPFDNYVFDSGYDTALIPQDHVDEGPTDADGNPTGTAIRTSDGTGSVLIDHSGLVHAWFGEMYVQDIDLTDGNSTFFPTWSGVRYWNQTMGDDTSVTIAGLIDADGDGAFGGPADNTQLGSYFTSITSFITSGVDADNNLFIAYSALTENYSKENATPNLQFLRHLFVTASMDGGETWLDVPVDIIRPETVLEPDLQPAVEAVFPSMAKLVDGKMHIVYQQDFEPGLSIRGDMDPAGTNFINYIGVTIDEVGFDTNTEEVVDAEIFNFEVSPNPATDRVFLSYELSEQAKVTLTVTNMVGQVIHTAEAANHFSGLYNTQMDVSNWAKGIYLVHFRANDKLAVQKVVVE